MNRPLVSLFVASVVAATLVGPVIGQGVTSEPMSERSTYDLEISGLSVGADGELCVERVNDDVVRISGEDVTFDDLSITLVAGTDNETTLEASTVTVPDGEEIHIYTTDGNSLIDTLGTIEGFTGIGCLPGLELFDLPIPLGLDLEVYKIETSHQRLEDLRLRKA